jgi:HAD superfamily hydrolase (TIGR01509 family)
LLKVSCVLFDLCGVVVNWHNSWRINEISKTFNISKDLFEQEFERNVIFLSSGKMTEEQFWNNMGNHLNSVELSKQDSLLEPIFRKFVSVNDSVIKLTRKLKENGISIGILSNTEVITFLVVEELISLDHFDFKSLSYKIGHVKPNHMIYQHVIENTPFQKEELFFIDDLKSNIDSAHSSGIDAVQYTDFNELLKECHLRELL